MVAAWWCAALRRISESSLTRSLAYFSFLFLILACSRPILRSPFSLSLFLSLSLSLFLCGVAALCLVSTFQWRYAIQFLATPLKCDATGLIGSRSGRHMLRLFHGHYLLGRHRHLLGHSHHRRLKAGTSVLIGPYVWACQMDQWKPPWSAAAAAAAAAG
jgi:hypothetical protein